MLHCSPNALEDLQKDIRVDTRVLRWMTLKQESFPKLGEDARNPGRAKPPDLESIDLEADPTDAMRWEYRNLVMQRVFEGRTKQELIAEQLLRHRYQENQKRANALPFAKAKAGSMIADLRQGAELLPARDAPPQLPGGGGDGEPPGVQ